MALAGEGSMFAVRLPLEVLGLVLQRGLSRGGRVRVRIRIRVRVRLGLLLQRGLFGG